jgi:hypothetical protein
MPDALAVIPICLFNVELVALGAGTPPQGTNVNTPPKRLLAQRQGTGQHQGSCKPPPFGVGSLTHTHHDLVTTNGRRGPIWLGAALAHDDRAIADDKLDTMLPDA